MSNFNPTTLISIDTEGTGLEYWQGDRPFAVPLCDQDGSKWYCDWEVDPLTRQVHPRKRDVRFLNDLLGNDQQPKVFFNAKYDVRMLSGVGVTVKGPIIDVHFMARICNSLELPCALKPLAWKYAGIPMDDEGALQKEVVRCRKIAVKRGWKIHEAVAADYWIPKAIDPNSKHCEQYACTDALRTVVLFYLYLSIIQEEGLEDAYKRECDLWPVLFKMENRGVRIDRQRNREELLKARQKRLEALKAMRRMLKRDGISWGTKEPFNPDSDIQLRKVLYTGYGLKTDRKTKKAGQQSTDVKAIRPLQGHPFVRELIHYRAGDKGETTYFGSYARRLVPDHVIEGAHCLHFELTQSETKTTRLSCRNPNLQNITKDAARSLEAMPAREPFGPRKGYVWLKLDYANQEVRIFADAANVPQFINDLKKGVDPFLWVTNSLWGGETDEAYQAAAYALELGTPNLKAEAGAEGARKDQVTAILAVWRQIGWNSILAARKGVSSEEARHAARTWLQSFDFDIVKAEKSINKKSSRTRGKSTVYAVMYGGGAGAIQDMLFVPYDEAKRVRSRFYGLLPEIRTFTRELALKARADGVIYNAYGRRLNIEPGKEYKAINWYVQSTAGDMMKESMIKVDAYFERLQMKRRVDAHIAISVHDELNCEVRREFLCKWLARGIKQKMEDTGGRINIPMVVDCELVEHNWMESVPYEV